MHLVGMGGDDVSEFESGYEKALRRYPAKWRELNGDVPLGILLDRAEHAGVDGVTVRRERMSIMAAGFAERTRFVFPITTGVLTVCALVAGMLLSTAGVAPWGQILWFVVGPTLLVWAIAGSAAATAGRWSSRIIAGAGTGMLSVAAVAGTMWMVFRRDDPAPGAPGIEAVWIGTAAYAVLAGITALIALGPAFRRAGLGAFWSTTVAFACGTVGAMITLLLALSGFGLVLVAALVVVLTVLEQRQAARRRPLAQRPSKFL